MRLVGIALVLVASTARADVFAFTDVEGFERCMRLDHLVEKVTTPTGSQARVLGAREIQARCVAAAARLIAQAKQRDEALALIAAAKRLGPWENAIEMVGALGEFAPAGCGELAAYEVVARALDRPKSVGYFPRARAAVKRCLKDAGFRSDFIEEKDSAAPTLRAHACEILIDEKLIKACPAARP